MEPGDRVLVRNVGLKGRQKLADKWQKHPYVVTNQPIPGIPIYEVKKENSIAKPTLLHRNMLLPFVGLSDPDEEESINPPRDKRNVEKELEIESESDVQIKESSSDDSDYSEEEMQLRRPRYKLPVRGASNQKTDRNKAGRSDSMAQQPSRKGQRQRRPPERFQAGQRNIQTEEYVFYVDPKDVVFG